jgi:predicted nucleic acid-binding protein
MRELFDEASNDAATLLMSAVNWGEIITVAHRRLDAKRLDDFRAGLARLPIQIEDASVTQAESAGVLRAKFAIPYVDAFAASLTLAHSDGPTSEQATLVTADYDFKALPKGTIEIDFLPAK